MTRWDIQTGIIRTLETKYYRAPDRARGPADGQRGQLWVWSLPCGLAQVLGTVWQSHMELMVKSMGKAVWLPSSSSPMIPVVWCPFLLL